MNTKNTSKLFDIFNVYDIRSRISKINQGEDLYSTMVQMAMYEGISQQEADEITNQILESVIAFDNLKNSLENDTVETLDGLFEEIDQIDSKTRIEILSWLHTGLEMFADGERFDTEVLNDIQNHSGLSFEEKREWSAEYEEELKQVLRDKAKNPEVSAEIIKFMAESIGKCDHSVKAEAMGVSGYYLKCLSALELYLIYCEEMDIQECVLYVCTNVEMQSVGDAVSRGIMTEKAAADIIKTLIYTAVFFIPCLWIIATITGNAGIAVLSPLMLKAVSKIKPETWLNFSIMGGILTFITNSVFGKLIDKAANDAGKFIGEMGIVVQYLIQKAAKSVAEGLLRITIFMDPAIVSEPIEAKMPSEGVSNEETEWDDEDEDDLLMVHFLV